MKQIRAEQRPVRFLEQKAGLPTVRDMRRPKKSEAIPSCFHDFTVSKALGWPERQTVIDTDELTHETAHGKGLGSQCLPFGQRATFIGLEMTEGDPPQTSGLPPPLSRPETSFWGRCETEAAPRPAREID